jgi:hypothetical protein
MAGEIHVVGVECRCLAGEAAQHRRPEIVHHDLLGKAVAEEGKGVLMTGEELLHALVESELHIQQAAVAEHHHEQRELAAGLANGHRPVGAPVDLRTFTGGEGEGQKGRCAAWAHDAHVVLDDGVAAFEAVLAQALEDLLGAVGMGFEPLADLGFIGIELARTRRALAGTKAWLGDPLGHRAPIQIQGPCDLRDLQAALLAILADLAEGLVVDHDSSPRAWRKSSRMARNCPVGRGGGAWGNGGVGAEGSSANT